MTTVEPYQSIYFGEQGVTRFDKLDGFIHPGSELNLQFTPIKKHHQNKIRCR
jgi:hypothetical protein